MNSPQLSDSQKLASTTEKQSSPLKKQQKKESNNNDDNSINSDNNSINNDDNNNNRHYIDPNSSFEVEDPNDSFDAGDDSANGTEHGNKDDIDPDDAQMSAMHKLGKPDMPKAKSPPDSALHSSGNLNNNGDLASAEEVLKNTMGKFSNEHPDLEK